MQARSLEEAIRFADDAAQRAETWKRALAQVKTALAKFRELGCNADAEMDGCGAIVLTITPAALLLAAEPETSRSSLAEGQQSPTEKKAAPAEVAGVSRGSNLDGAEPAAGPAERGDDTPGQAPGPTHYMDPWTKAEEDRLWEMRQAGKSYREISAELNRSLKACQVRFSTQIKPRKERERLAGASSADVPGELRAVAKRYVGLPNPQNFTPGEDLQIVEGLAAGIKLDRIAADLTTVPELLRKRFDQLVPGKTVEEQERVVRFLRVQANQQETTV